MLKFALIALLLLANPYFGWARPQADLIPDPGFDSVPGAGPIVSIDEQESADQEIAREDRVLQVDPIAEHASDTDIQALPDPLPPIGFEKSNDKKDADGDVPKIIVDRGGGSIGIEGGDRGATFTVVEEPEEFLPPVEKNELERQLPVNDEKKPQKSSLTWLWILLGILALIALIALLAYILMSRNKKKGNVIPVAEVVPVQPITITETPVVVTGPPQIEMVAARPVEAVENIRVCEVVTS